MKLVLLYVSGVLLFTACHHGRSPSVDNSSLKDSSVGIMDTNVDIQDSSVNINAPENLPDFLIEPGKRIGKTYLEQDAVTLSQNLGKPDYSDAAMGKAWLRWYGKKRDEHNNRTQLDIYITYKDTSMTSKVIKQIHTTSSSFLLNDSIHVYSDFSTIKNAFPGIKYVGKYTDEGRKMKLYDEIQQGIAFEIAAAGDQQICTGIIVHIPGDPVTSVYVALHPDFLPE